MRKAIIVPAVIALGIVLAIAVYAPVKRRVPRAERSTPPTQTTPVQNQSGGAEWGFFLIPQLGDPLQELTSVRWSRLTGLWWGRVQKADGSYDWSELDERVRRAQQDGYNLILEFKTGNNELVSDPTCYRAVQSYGKAHSDELFAQEGRLHSCPIKPEYLPRWKNFIRDVIARYGGAGPAAMPGLKSGFKMDIQIENEAANPYYWHWNELDGKFAAASFLPILKAAVEARDETNPQVKIILPGFIDPNFLGRCTKDPNYAAYCSGKYFQRGLAFTKELLKYPELFDAIDVHFFNYFKFDSRYISDGIEWFRAEMRANGYEKPIYSLEWTGSIMMMVKTEGHADAFAKYFPYAEELGSEEAFGAVYKNLPAPQNAKYREWFETEQAREFPKLFVTMLAGGVKRMVHVRFSDYAGVGWDSLWWNWQGIVRYTGTMANPVLIKKPSYYAYEMLETKLKDFTEVSALRVEGDVFAYKFTFAAKPPVYVVWTEGQATTIDLSAFGAAGNVSITRVVTELDDKNKPVRAPGVRVPASAVPLTDTPAFVEGV